MTWFEKVYGLTVDEYHDEVIEWLYAERVEERNEEKAEASKNIDWDKIKQWANG